MPSPAAGASCATAVGGAITIKGNGFDTNNKTNNTVLVGGYLAIVTAVASGGGLSRTR